MTSRIALSLRIGVVAFAALVCAWFALGVVQARSISRATAILGSSSALTQRQAARVRSLLSTASTLNPDLEVDVLSGELLQTERNSPAARRMYLSIVRREPKNVLAWDLLAQLGDPSALSQIARLEPDVTGG